MVLASSGTLLLCCVERTAVLPGLRRRCRAAFPGAARRQSSIMHVTLGRVLTAEPLPETVLATIAEKAAEWSAKVSGMRWSAPAPDAHSGRILQHRGGTKDRTAMEFCD